MTDAQRTRSNREFSGPLFLVGRPRSGTKLLMTLLNEHPRIAIPIAETNFFPQMVKRYGEPPQLHRPGQLEDFYRRFEETVFYDWRRRFEVVLSQDELARQADLNSWSSIFGTILRYHAPKPVEEGVIWGDKSPAYLTWIDGLKSIFKEAKVIHIVRDPRDQARSAQTAWGKHPYRSAEVWNRDVAAARRAGEGLGGDYLEVLYESLLTDPARTLREIAGFLGVDFMEELMSPSVSYEELGDATGRLEIVPGNQKKYRQSFSARTIKRIEEIVYPTMHDFGYEPDYAKHHRPLSPIMMRLLSVRDGLALTVHYGRVKGPTWGVKYLFNHAVARLTPRK